MTVAQNVAYGLADVPAHGACAASGGDAGGVSGSEIKVSASPGVLSGGERQRVALARSLAIHRACCCWTSR